MFAIVSRAANVFNCYLSGLADLIGYVSGHAIDVALSATVPNASAYAGNMRTVSRKRGETSAVTNLHTFF